VSVTKVTESAGRWGSLSYRRGLTESAVSDPLTIWRTRNHVVLSDVIHAGGEFLDALYHVEMPPTNRGRCPDEASLTMQKAGASRIAGQTPNADATARANRLPMENKV